MNINLYEETNVETQTSKSHLGYLFNRYCPSICCIPTTERDTAFVSTSTVILASRSPGQSQGQQLFAGNCSPPGVMGAINPFLEAKIGDFASQQWYCSSYFLKTCNRLLFMGFKLSQVILGPWLICPKFYALLLRRVQHLCPHFLRLFLGKKHSSRNVEKDTTFALHSGAHDQQAMNHCNALEQLLMAFLVCTPGPRIK